MEFSANKDHDITLEEASAMINRFKASSTGTLAHFFGKDAIQKIFDQEECVGMRLYNGLTEDNKNQIIVVGVKAGGNDIWDGELAERSILCPPDCSDPNPLNGFTI